MSPSPVCTVNASSTTNGVNISGSSTITIQLADLTGVNTWSISCISTDDKHVPATITASLSINNNTKTATFTSPADDGNGSALIFQSKVNNGKDVNGTTNDSFTTTFGVFILAASALRVTAPNQTTEGDATNGWSADLNTCLRNGSFTQATSSVAGAVKLTDDLGGTSGAPDVVGLTGNAGVVTATATSISFSASGSVDAATSLTLGGTNATSIQVGRAALTTLLSGGQRGAASLIGSDHTIDSANVHDFVLLVSTANNTVALTLPDPSQNNGRIIHIVDKANSFATHNCTLVRFGSEKIDGSASTKTLSTNGQRIIVYCDSVDWYTN